MSEDAQEQEFNIVEKKLAFIVDETVVDVLYTDERLAAIFLSQPQILDVTDNGESLRAVVGNIYDESTQKFMPPSPDSSYVWNEELSAWVPPLDPSKLNTEWIPPVGPAE
jgi:hypothetical protein